MSVFMSLFPGFGCFSCFKTLSLFKSGLKPDNRPFLLFLHTFCIQKCLETGEMTNTLENVCVSVSKNHYFCIQRNFPFQKCLGTGKKTKPLKKKNQGILSFLLFPDTFCIQGILLFLLFLDTFGKGWKVRNWKVGRLEGWKVGRLEC